MTTIGMSTFNNADTIKEAIESILTQTDPNIELSIIDAHSTDETQFICERFARQDSRVRYDRLDNQQRWYLNARSHLVQARGEFFMWGDADDIWSSNWVAELTSLLRNPSFDAAFGRLALVDQNSDLMMDHIAHGRKFTYTAERNPGLRFLRYVADPEPGGKSNLIYSLWKTDALRVLDPWRELMDPFFEEVVARDLDIFFLARALKKARVASNDSCTIFRRIPSQVPSGQANWKSVSQIDKYNPWPRDRLLKPRNWHAWRMDKSYSGRYASVASKGQRPLIWMIALIRTFVSVAGRLWARLLRMM
jgi:glycosyltransferase involved in cell wall biosynthesis